MTFRSVLLVLASTLFVLQTASLSAQQAIDVMPPREQGVWQTLIMIALVIAFFYFVLWRPEQQRRKALERQRASLKKGDRVVAMGIIGQVQRIEKETLILKMYDGSKIEVLKGAVTDLLDGSKEETSSSEEQPSSIPPTRQEP